MTNFEWILENRADDVYEFLKDYSVSASLTFAPRAMQELTFEKWLKEEAHHEPKIPNWGV